MRLLSGSTWYSHTTDMGVGSSALCDVREARTRTGNPHRSHRFMSEANNYEVNQQGDVLLRQVSPPEAPK